MNLILFEEWELHSPLSMSDPRAQHIAAVLRCKVGDTFDVGVINGLRGKGTLIELSDSELSLEFEWTSTTPSPSPISLIVGLPRPQSARRLLQEVTAVGVRTIEFVRTERADPSYARSKLWSSGEWRRHLVSGAQQAFCTRLPNIVVGRELRQATGECGQFRCRLALDNYESTQRLIRTHVESPVVLAVGPERGWSGGDRAVLREARFSFVDVGPRVLRVETASAVGASVVRQLLDID